MAKNLAVGEMIYVPAALVDVEDLPSAFLRTAVEDVAGRKVRITFRGADHWIASSRCQRNVGLLIICIGDWATEATLLDPLSKTVLQFCRLLVPDDQVRFYKVRSIAELRAIWVREHATYSHVILIGHGNGSAVQFANDRWQTAAQLDPVLSIPGAAAKYFVNLACQGGQAPPRQAIFQSRSLRFLYWRIS
ncbi:hypothetical protein HY78_03825 [Rhizorhabdus wittichii DC-6]|nr:hypothetical protein HY78_03825 [Rhizorhabdus wittichii DC-6]